MDTYLNLLDEIAIGNYKSLARGLTLVENDIYPSSLLLKELRQNKNVPVLGITGPPGAGKSTLVNAIASELIDKNLRVAILAVDPTSPFNFGSLLGDRIRMTSLFNQDQVFIRSLATRGALGGISAKTIEMIDLMKSSIFDLIIVETVGVGQSEVEIAGLADQTIVVLVPESGDEIQNIKSGLMEIADAFVVNKADREGADLFFNNLNKIIHQGVKETPIFKTIAEKNIGVEALCNWILSSDKHQLKERKAMLFAEKAFKIIQHNRMKDVDKKMLHQKISEALEQDNFNLYRFVENY